MPVEMQYTETLTVTSCWCGIRLAIPDNLYRFAHRKKHDIYCPLGHIFVYHETVEEKLAQERLEHRATRELLEHEQRSHSATKGQMTKLKRRVHAGVCPHCQRHFANVERHMQTKHAELQGA
jgi:hypothetical protein